MQRMCNIALHRIIIIITKPIRSRKNSLGLQWWKSGLLLSLCRIYVLTRGIKVLHRVNRGRKERFRRIKERLRGSIVAYKDQN